MLPATGAPFSKQRTTKMKEMFDEYVKKKTQENWKFYIVSLNLFIVSKYFLFLVLLLLIFTFYFGFCVSNIYSTV